MDLSSTVRRLHHRKKEADFEKGYNDIFIMSYAHRKTYIQASRTDQPVFFLGHRYFAGGLSLPLDVKMG